MLVQLSDLKDHVRLTAEDVEFDRELSRFLMASENRVIAYINRKVHKTSIPEGSPETDVLLDGSIEAGILDLAGYYFDNKGQLDDSMVESILDSTVGHLRIVEV